jgi:hypothetical protein
MRQKKSVTWKDKQHRAQPTAPQPSRGALKVTPERRAAMVPGSLWVMNQEMMQDAAWTDGRRWTQHELPYLISASMAVGLAAGILKKGTPAVYMGDVRVEEHDGATRMGTVRLLRAVLLVGSSRYIVSDMNVFDPACAKAEAEEVG